MQKHAEDWEREQCTSVQTSHYPFRKKMVYVTPGKKKKKKKNQSNNNNNKY